MAVEIECKIYIAELEPLRIRLNETQATLIKPRVFEKNYRYENPAKTLSPNGIVLRLRQDQDIRITYKARLDSDTEGIVKRLELETSVGDFDTMDAILNYLGFSVYMIYEKYRTTYHFADIPNAEIVVDEMPYGHFIEVEGDPAAIERVIDRLGLGGEKRIVESYTDLFDRIRDDNELSFANLTFENFTNIVIDSAIFK